MSSPTAPVEPAEPLWRNRDFTLLWSSQTLSALGGQATYLAIPLLVLTVTGSPVDAGVAGTAYAAAQSAMRLPGGVLADRWSRRRAMLLSDAARVVLLALLVTSIGLDFVSYPLILCVVIGIGTFDVIFSPAEIASLPRLVAKHQLPQAFAQNEARQYGASLAGPPLGGLLYGIGRAAPFLLDLITYAVSFVAVAAIRGPLSAPADDHAGTTIRTAIRQGLQYVWHTPFLRALVTVSAPLNFAVTGALFSTTVVLREQGVSAGAIGLAQGVVACGGLLGAFAAPALAGRISLRRLIITIAWLLVLCLSAATALTGHLTMVVPLAIGIFFAPTANAALFGHLAATTPHALQGRVSSVIIFTAQSLAATAPFAAGALIGGVLPVAGMLLCAVAALGAGVAGTFAPGLRTPSRPGEPHQRKG